MWHIMNFDLYAPDMQDQTCTGQFIRSLNMYSPFALCCPNQKLSTWWPQIHCKHQKGGNEVNVFILIFMDKLWTRRDLCRKNMSSTRAHVLLKLTKDPRRTSYRTPGSSRLWSLDCDKSIENKYCLQSPVTRQSWRFHQSLQSFLSQMRSWILCPPWRTNFKKEQLDVEFWRSQHFTEYPAFTWRFHKKMPLVTSAFFFPSFPTDWPQDVVGRGHKLLQNDSGSSLWPLKALRSDVWKKLCDALCRLFAKTGSLFQRVNPLFWLSRENVCKKFLQC